MRFQLFVVKFMALSVLMLFVAAQSHATTVSKVRGGSNYGPLTNFMSCADGSANNPCEAFGTPSTVSFGGTDFTVSQFVFGGPGGPGTVLNLVDLGVLTANQTFTLPTGLFDPAKVEIFACGGGAFDGSVAAVDSSGGPISTFCTQGLLSLPPIDLNGSAFTTGAGYSLTSHLVLDAPASGPITGTPEPGTFLLLGLGLAALAGLSLRNQFRTVAIAKL
jgi:hypothetical protein